MTETLTPTEQRGLTLISALINFVDWLNREGLLRSLPDQERARLVLKFFDAHTKGENYFLQAERIMEILGEPFATSISECDGCTTPQGEIKIHAVTGAEGHFCHACRHGNQCDCEGETNA